MEVQNEKNDHSIIYFLSIFCENSNERDRVFREGLLCMLISESISENNPRNQTIGNILCMNQSSNKIQKLESDSNFNFSSH